jgi:hypothetical protein
VCVRHATYEHNLNLITPNCIAHAQSQEKSHRIGAAAILEHSRNIEFKIKCKLELGLSNAKSNSVKAENYNVYKSNSKSNRKSGSVNTL